MQIQFTLTGISALLMHHDNIEGSDDVRAWSKDPENKNVSVAGDDRTPPWTWQTYLYSDGTNIAIPAENLMVALRQAGARKILQRQKTYKEVTQTGIVIMNEFLEFKCAGKMIPMAKIREIRDEPFKTQADAVLALGFRLFMKRARIGSSKHVRVRARFNEWTVSGKADILAQELTMETLAEIFSLAGRVGLCDWRPGCRTPGVYGQFEAKIKKA